MLEHRESWKGGSLEEVVMGGNGNSGNLGCDHRAGEIGSMRLVCGGAVCGAWGEVVLDPRKMIQPIGLGNVGYSCSLWDAEDQTQARIYRE